MQPATSAANEPISLTIVRELDAPPALVFRAWTRPEMAARWWGPKGFVTEKLEMDARTGGRYRHTMRSPEGTLHTKQGVYREVREPERLVLTYAWEDEAGRPKHLMLVTVTFEAAGDGTRLTLHHSEFESTTARDLHHGGWSSCLDRFADYLAEETTR
jgi:uncharacterized protein YndB with AHSA1/START domain